MDLLKNQPTKQGCMKKDKKPEERSKTIEPSFASILKCGPQSESCECNCPDGECGHKWDEWEEIENGGSAKCSKCGMLAIDHDMWVMP